MSGSDGDAVVDGGALVVAVVVAEVVVEGPGDEVAVPGGAPAGVDGDGAAEQPPTATTRVSAIVVTENGERARAGRAAGATGAGGRMIGQSRSA